MARRAEELGYRLAVARRPPPVPLRRRVAPRAVGGLDDARRASPRRRPGSSSGRSSPRPPSTTRRCWPRWPPRSTRSAADASSSASARAGTRPSSGPSASRSTTGSTASRRPSRSSGRSSATARSTSTAATSRPATASSCRGRRGRAGRRSSSAAEGERMLRITLPHVDAWNVWFNDTGNSPAGVPPLRELVDGTCREVGRDPADGRADASPSRSGCRRHRAASRATTRSRRSSR